MVASCGFFEDELSQFSKEQGVILADSVETPGVDLRKRVKRPGAEEKARRKQCNVRKNYMQQGVKKLLCAGMMPARTWRAHAVEMSPRRG